MHHQLPKILADVGAVGKVFRNDVVGSGQGILDGIDAQLFVDVFLGKALGVGTVLGEDGLGQGSQPLFSCHGAPGAPLLLVGTVEILYLGHGLGLINGGGQFLRELALVFDGFFYFLPPCFQIPQIGQAGFQIPQGGVVHGAVHFLPIPGDEGNGVSLVQQLDDVFHIFLLLFQFLRQNFGN